MPWIAASFEQRLKLVTDRLVRDGLICTSSRLRDSGKPLWRIAPDPAHFDLPEHVRERPSRRKDLLESRSPPGADHRIGVFAGGQDRKSETVARRATAGGPDAVARGGGGLSGRIAIEAEDRLGREAPKLT